MDPERLCKNTGGSGLEEEGQVSGLNAAVEVGFIHAGL